MAPFRLRPFIVSDEDHCFLASEQQREAGFAFVAALLEPMGRNAAPALTLAALAVSDNVKTLNQPYAGRLAETCCRYP